MFAWFRKKVLQIGGAAIIVGALMALLEWSNTITEEKDLKVLTGTLVAVPMEPIKVKGVTIKSYKVLVQTSDGVVHRLLPHVGLVSTEKYAPYVGKPVTAKVSKTNYIYVLQVDGQELISYEKMRKLGEQRAADAYVMPLYIALGGIVFLAFGYFLPKSRRV